MFFFTFRPQPVPRERASQSPAPVEAISPESDYSRPAWPEEATWMRQGYDTDTACPTWQVISFYSRTISIKIMLFFWFFFCRSQPPPRERASQSPAPGEQDLKRYSKRPLRGPYGQMLEAEMKKPNKQNYDGLLEELNRAER